VGIPPSWVPEQRSTAKTSAAMSYPSMNYSSSRNNREWHDDRKGQQLSSDYFGFARQR
jgi:hypothetical protein